MDKYNNKIYAITHGTNLNNFKNIIKSGYMKPNKLSVNSLFVKVNYFSISMKKNYKNLLDLIKNDPNIKNRIDDQVILFFDSKIMKDCYYINIPAIFGLISHNTYVSPKLKIALENNNELKKFKKHMNSISEKINIPIHKSSITEKKMIQLLEKEKSVWNELCIINKLPIKEYLKFITISQKTYEKNKTFFDNIEKKYSIFVI